MLLVCVSFVYFRCCVVMLFCYAFFLYAFQIYCSHSDFEIYEPWIARRGVSQTKVKGYISERSKVVRNLIILRFKTLLKSPTSNYDSSNLSQGIP